MNSTFSNVTADQLRRAAKIKEKIDALQSQLVSILGGTNSGAAEPAPRRKWTMSAAARAKIGAAQRARWARTRGEKKK
ncbi:MAG: hypothetical protein H7Y43_15635 [Akkermansiaceae bacterium]|nr:hypothetical protein [Verrucomicrobiales bacterium]